MFFEVKHFAFSTSDSSLKNSKHWAYTNKITYWYRIKKWCWRMNSKNSVSQNNINGLRRMFRPNQRSKSTVFFLNVSLTKIVVIIVKGLEAATSCVKDQDATTAPARHMWETGSLNWAWFMLLWFIRFPEFAEINVSSVPFRKNANEAQSVNWSQVAKWLAR